MMGGGFRYGERERFNFIMDTACHSPLPQPSPTKVKSYRSGNRSKFILLVYLIGCRDIFERLASWILFDQQDKLLNGEDEHKKYTVHQVCIL